MRWLPKIAVPLICLAFLYAFQRYYVRSPGKITQPIDLSNCNTILHATLLQALNNGRWIRSFKTANGTIYLRGHLQSRDGGQTVQPQTSIDFEPITASPEGAIFSDSDIFYALDGPAIRIRAGIYQVQGWRSNDDLQTIETEYALIEVPNGPTRPRQKGEWYGLYVYRTILELPDGTWLMSMYGNFNQDELVPNDLSSKHEVKFMMRTFIVTSRDRGRTWHYLSSVAVPKTGDPIGEGFVEPAITRLNDGRLLCIMRTGHHYPLYASWSSDNGKTWTAPFYTGIDRACDPCLIKLHDGRLALSWGRRYPEGWSKITPEGDRVIFKYPGEGYINLAISADGGTSWLNNKVAKRTGSCYSTIFEVEPNVIFLQVDQWVWHVVLNTGDNS